MDSRHRIEYLGLNSMNMADSACLIRSSPYGNRRAGAGSCTVNHGMNPVRSVQHVLQHVRQADGANGPFKREAFLAQMLSRMFWFLARERKRSSDVLI